MEGDHNEAAGSAAAPASVVAADAEGGGDEFGASVETASQAVEAATVARDAISEARSNADEVLAWATTAVPARARAAGSNPPAGGSSGRAAAGAMLRPFKLERYFADYEFSAPHLLCCSDAEALTMKELLELNRANGEAGRELQERWDTLSLGYTESRGDPTLLGEVSGLYEGGVVAAEGPRAAVVMAPQEGVFLGMKAMLEPVAEGDAVVCMSPGYQSLYGVAEALGCEVLKWEPDQQEQEPVDTPGVGEGRAAAAAAAAASSSLVPARFSIATLQALLDGAAATHTKKGAGAVRAVVVNFPHNPTGFLPTREEFRELVGLCRARGCFLFCDEMYRDLEYDGPDRRLPSAVEMGYERAVALSGVSKALSLPGLRIGWLVSTSPAFLHRVTELHDYTTICNSAPSEVLACMALRCREAILARNRAIVAANLCLLRAFFARHAGRFAWAEPEAGTVCFPRLLTPMAAAPGAAAAEGGDAVDVTKYCKWLVETHGVMLLPSSVYDGFPVPCFRLGFGRRNLEAALEIWEATLL